MPFQKPWVNPQQGDLIYGVDSDLSRKYYIKYNKDFKGKVFTVDSLAVMTDETGKTQNQEFLEAVATHNKYRSVLTQDLSSNEAVRRKCKAGLEWAVTHNKVVHFVLDDLDLNAVVDKNWAGTNPDRPANLQSAKNRSITGSELRWIYRNRFRSEVRARIQFWIMCEQCLPPWEADVTWMTPRGSVIYKSSGWQRYVPRSEVVEFDDIETRDRS